MKRASEAHVLADPLREVAHFGTAQKDVERAAQRSALAGEQTRSTIVRAPQSAPASERPEAIAAQSEIARLLPDDDARADDAAWQRSRSVWSLAHFTVADGRMRAAGFRERAR